MGGIISRQPNGRYCRYSSVVETFTHINMTREDYINNFTGNVCNEKDGVNTLERHLGNFPDVLSAVSENNMNFQELKDVFIKMIDIPKDAETL